MTRRRSSNLLVTNEKLIMDIIGKTETKVIDLAE